MQKYYPALLVLSQYGLMALMFLFSRTVLSGISLWLFALGFAIGLWAIAHNRIGNFHIRPEFKSGAVLVTTGIYRFIRHPMYLSVAVMMLAVLTANPSPAQWIMYTILLLTLYLKARREESLWLQQDPAYAAYQKKSKIFLPFIL